MARIWRTRRFYRVQLDLPVVLRINRVHRKQVRLAQKNVPGKLLDLSEGGCGVEISLFIPKATRVNLLINRSVLVAEPGGKAPPAGCTRITGAAVACTVHAERKYRLGLQFVKVSKRDKGLIAEFVKHHERRRASRPEA